LELTGANTVETWATGTLSATGTVDFAAGTVGTPSLRFGGDTTTGVYRIGANNLGVSISGAKVLDIASTGLAVTGTLSTAGNITNNNADPYLILNRTATTNYNGIKLLTGNATTGGWEIYGTAAASQNLNIYSYAASSAIGVFSSTGLSVTGALAASGNISTTSGDVLIRGAAGGQITQNSGAGGLYIANTGTSTTMRLLVTNGAAASVTALTLAADTGAATFASTLAATGITGSGSAIFGNTSTPSTSVPGTQINNPFSVGPSIFSQASATGNRWIDFMGSSATVASFTNDSGVFSIQPGGGVKANFSSTGLAVTGTLSSTTTVTATTEFHAVSPTNTGSASFRSAFTTCGMDLANSLDTSGVGFINFRRADSTQIGGIARVGTTNAVVYNTTSDARLKENLRDFTDSGRLIDALKPRVFDWKDSDNNGKDVIGFIAQEEHAADPVFSHIGAVSVGDDNPTTITKQWQRSDAALIPILVAELQSLRKRLASLESK